MVFTLEDCVDAVLRMSVYLHYCSDIVLLNSLLMAECKSRMFLLLLFRKM